MVRPPRGFIGTVGLTGGAAAMAALVLLPREGQHWGSFVVLVCLASIAALVPIRWVRDEGTQGFTLEGGVLVAILLTGPVGLAPIVHLLASFLAHSTRSREPEKWVFNAGRTGLETAAGAATFWLLAPETTSPTDPRTLAALLLAAIVYEVVSIGTMVELFHRMAGTPRRSALGEVTDLSFVTFSINTSYGLVLGTVALVSPWTTALSGLLMVGLYVGFRGHAAAIVDGARARSLHDFTSQLLDVPLSADPMPAVITRLAEMFGATRSDLVVQLDGQWFRWTLREGALAVESLESLPRTGPIGAAAAREAGHLEVTTLDHSTEARLSAPIRRQGEPVGAIVLGGRRGLEPWDEADAVMLSAVANEFAVALDNVTLFGQVEQERARLEAESTKLTDILTAATDGIVAVTGRGLIEAWNPGMARITGVEPDVAIGQPWHAVLRLRDTDGRELPPTGDHLVSRIMSGEQAGVTLSLQALRADGVWRWLECTSSPVRHHDGGPGVVIVARDVTTERELEELKSDFIATVSHELRTPLTPLKGFLSTLRSPRTPLSDDQLSTIHGAMGSQLVRLETLISDLLAVAELDHGQFALQPEPLELLSLIHI